MKLNLDCIRDVMLEAEKQPFGEELTFHSLKLQLNNYSEDELAYTCIKLKEAGLITAMIINADNFTHVQFINDITYEGHQFLANIHSDNIWKKTKSVLGEIGSTSISTVIQVASGVVQSVISAKLSH